MNIEIVPNLRPLTEDEVSRYIQEYPGVGLVRFGEAFKFAFVLYDETPIPTCRLCDVPCEIQRTYHDTNFNPKFTLLARCLEEECQFNIYYEIEPGVVDEDTHAIFPDFEIEKAFTPDQNRL